MEEKEPSRRNYSKILEASLQLTASSVAATATYMCIRYSWLSAIASETRIIVGFVTTFAGLGVWALEDMLVDNIRFDVRKQFEGDELKDRVLQMMQLALHHYDTAVTRDEVNPVTIAISNAQQDIEASEKAIAVAVEERLKKAWWRTLLRTAGFVLIGVGTGMMMSTHHQTFIPKEIEYPRV